MILFVELGKTLLGFVIIKLRLPPPRLDCLPDRLWVATNKLVKLLSKYPAFDELFYAFADFIRDDWNRLPCSFKFKVLLNQGVYRPVHGPCLPRESPVPLGNVCSLQPTNLLCKLRLLVFVSRQISFHNILSTILVGIVRVIFTRQII